MKGLAAKERDARKGKGCRGRIGLTGKNGLTWKESIDEKWLMGRERFAGKGYDCGELVGKSWRGRKEFEGVKGEKR